MAHLFCILKIGVVCNVTIPDIRILDMSRVLPTVLRYCGIAG